MSEHLSGRVTCTSVVLCEDDGVMYACTGCVTQQYGLVLLYMYILIVFIFNNNLVVKQRKKMCMQSKGEF